MTSEKLHLLDIFSYSCMNCLRSMKYMEKLDNKYKRYGLKTVLIHPPEWEFEKRKNNIVRFKKDCKISFPIIIDKNKKIIKKLKVNFWPTQILIKGNEVLYKHIGEGNYKELENKITKSLKIKTNKIFGKEPKYTKHPMIYAGKNKKGKIGKIRNRIKFGIIYVDGIHKQNKEFLKIKGSLAIMTKGRKINFVAKSISNKPIKVKVNNKKSITISNPGLYSILESKSSKPRKLTLETKNNLEIYSFSFE